MPTYLRDPSQVSRTLASFYAEKTRAAGSGAAGSGLECLQEPSEREAGSLSDFYVEIKNA